MKRTLTIILSGIFMIATLAACSTGAPVQVSTAPNIRTVSSTGLGEVYVVPDIAYINVGVHTEADTVSAALEKNSVQAQQVADALTALGVEAKDIQTTNFYVYPMNTYDNTTGLVSGTYYSVDNSVYVTVRDLPSLGSLLDAVVNSGANTINSISFDIQNKDAATAQARDLAIEKAISEAEAIASAAGVKLGDLQSVSVSSSGYATQVYDGKGGGGMTASANVPVSAGQLLISVTAYTTYIIK
jgi:uncharacterized protein YggE